MTSREEKLSFVRNYSSGEWRILASNPRFLNSLNESTTEAGREASILLKRSSNRDTHSRGMFSSVRIEKANKTKLDR